jgi:putative addiction module CopG family antidote
MGTARQVSVTLAQDLVELVESKIESGEYATESDVIVEGLRALQAQDRALEHWLRTEVVETYDRVEDGREKSFSPEQVRARIAEWARKTKPSA